MSYIIKTGALIKDKINPKRLRIFNLFNTNFQKRVLISYITAPFIVEERFGHSSFAEVKSIAEIFNNFKYQVDIIRYDGNFGQINFGNRQYDLVFGLEPNFLKVVSKFKPKNSIYYATGAYWKFNNDAEEKRITELFKRKKIQLLNRRAASNHQSSDIADAVISIGNDWTKNTYTKHAKKVETIRVSAFSFFPYSQIASNKNWNSAKKKFLWFGSVGAVHKGLDLLLEIFSKHPNLELFICGAVEKEKDFVNLYHKELFETKNIHLIGWVSPDSKEFAEIMTNCAFTILPSCSEGMSGAIATCMHSGLIPLISRQCGIDIDDIGEIFKNNSIETIEKTIIKFSQIDNFEVKELSVRSFVHAKKNYTAEVFRQDFSKALKNIL